jgi:hypothetical protein
MLRKYNRTHKKTTSYYHLITLLVYILDGHLICTNINFVPACVDTSDCCRAEKLIIFCGEKVWNKFETDVILLLKRVFPPCIRG